MKKNKKTIHYSCISLCFCAGLVFTIFVSVHLYSINLSNSFLVVAFAFFFTLLNCFVFKKFGRVFFAVLAGVLFALLRVEKINQDRKHSIDFVGRQHDIELTISNTPTIKQNNWHFESDSLIIDGEKLQSPTYISLSAGVFSLDSGDKLTLRASPSVGFGKYAL